ncbi:MAG TPA: hypothetical protein VF092_03535 [Longimicrobium sp.]
MEKKTLKLDALAVSSFETADAAPDLGTVEAREADCTAPATCKCPTSLWACGTIAATRYSCPRTFDC